MYVSQVCKNLLHKSWILGGARPPQAPPGPPPLGIVNIISILHSESLLYFRSIYLTGDFSQMRKLRRKCDNFDHFYSEKRRIWHFYVGKDCIRIKGINKLFWKCFFNRQKKSQENLTRSKDPK